MRQMRIFLVAGLLITGCGGSKTGGVKNAADMPDFVLNPPKSTGALFGTGIAEQQSPQLAKETADLRARKEISAVLSTKVSTMLKDYLGQAGIGSTAEVTELSQSVTRAISDVELVGVTIEKREYIKGKMYSLAKYPLDDSMKKIVSDAVNRSLSSKEALLSQFRAKQGFEELDKQLDKMKASE
jgi:hypothetical protein